MKTLDKKLTKDRFKKGYSFFIKGEPNRIYNYLSQPDDMGFIAEKKHFLCNVSEVDDEGFILKIEMLGKVSFEAVKFSDCVDQDYSEFNEAIHKSIFCDCPHNLDKKFLSVSCEVVCASLRERDKRKSFN
ncbi:MAG: hypothetical protein MUC49_02055 [Raineya sp.]|jgi:hypothetical protein|nr:hypothetical protein [Raineya sp.]